MATKYDMSPTSPYFGEYEHYNLLFAKGNTITTTGIYSFTSSTSNETYSSATGGEMDVLNQLKTALSTYMVLATDINAKADVSDLNTHEEDNSEHVPHLGITTNVSNVYSVTSTKVISDNSKFSVKFNVAATDTATLNISSDGVARNLKKPDGNDFKPKAGIYTFIRDGLNFQLLGEGGEYGTAGIGDVRSTKTLATEDGVVQGTLDLTNLTSGNIKKGVVIDGVTGTYNDVEVLEAGDVWHASLNGAGINSSNATRLARCTVFKSGTIRVVFTMEGGSYTSGYAQIYVNNSPRGQLRYKNYSDYLGTTFIEDITVNANDVVSIYGYKEGSNSASLKNIAIGLKQSKLMGAWS